MIIMAIYIYSTKNTFEVGDRIKHIFFNIFIKTE